MGDEGVLLASLLANKGHTPSRPGKAWQPVTL